MMKRSMKKLTAILLAICMVLTMLPVAALAQETADSGETSYVLADGWTIIGEDQTNWGIVDENTVTIKPQNGDYYYSGSTLRATAKNVFLHDVEAADFEVSVKLEFQPEVNFATAGLLIYADDSANFALSRRYHTYFEKQTLGTHGVNGTSFAETHEADPVANQGPIWLKIVKTGTTLTALWSADGKVWTEHKTITWSSFDGKSAEDLKVGLYTGDSLSNNTKWATFSDFTIKYGNGEETVVPFAEVSDEETLWLSDMQWVSAQVGYSTAQKDVNVDGETITLIQADGSTKTYAKGLAAHAESEVVYDIEDMGLKKFISDVGVTRDKGSCGFIVMADNEEIYEVKCVKGTDPAHHIEVEIPSDAKTLTLLTTDGGIGIEDNMTHSDHSVWAGAYFEVDAKAAGQLRKINAVIPEYLTVDGKGQIVVTGELGNLTEADLSKAEFVYTSSDKDVLTIDENGVITAKADGVSTVTVSVTLGDVTKTADAYVVVGKGDDSVMFIESPDGTIQAGFVLDHNGTAKYMAFENQNVMIEFSKLGIVSDTIDFTEGLELVSVSEITKVVDEYELIGAKVSKVKAVANEMTMTFKKVGEAVQFKIIARMYDDGLAFRYAIDGKGEIAFSSEATTTKLPAASDVYAMIYIKHNEAIETHYTTESLSGDFCEPMLYKTPAGTWVLLSEAALHGNYCGTYLKASGDGSVNWHFSKEQSGDVVAQLPFESPWRFAVIGTAEEINLNTMGETLNPDAEGDWSWVKPGVTAWTWLNRESTKDRDTYLRYIDFAAEMGWEYLLLDEGWKPKGQDNGRSDKKYYGYYDWFTEVVERANEKGVKLLVWENHNDLKDDKYREELFAEYEKLGIAGIKPDFFDSSSQTYMQLYEDLIEDTAKYHLLLNLHGIPKPSGWRRTYPHLLTSEGVFGHEQELFKPAQVSAYHNIMLPFVRNAVGPADYTPMFSYQNSGSRRNFSLAHMAAMAVVYESGIQCLADRPDKYQRTAESELYFQDMPAGWDNSSLPVAKPGERLVMVRQNGEDFYVGGMTVEKWEYELDLSFLEPGKTYYAVLLTDGETVEDINGKLLTVTNETKLPINMLATGGFAMRIMADDPSADSITLDKTEMLVAAQGTATLTATVTKDGEAFDAAIVWASSDETVATVSGGTVNAISGGTATITATITGFGGVSKSASCQVTVTPATYELGEDWTLVNADNRVNWDIIDENTVTIKPQNGDYYYSGSTLRATAKNVFLHDVKAADFEVSVKLEFQPEVNFATAGLLIYADDSANFALSRRYHTYFEKQTLGTHGVNGTSFAETHEADPVANQGPIWLKIVKTGTTLTALWSADGKVWTEHKTITWSSFDGKSAEELKVGLYTGDSLSNNTKWATFSDFTIKYTDSDAVALPFAVKNVVPVYGIELNVAEAELEIGGELTLTADLFPANADDKTVTWTSSDESIAIVVDGKVTAVGPGKATITVTTADGAYSASCTVTVEDPSAVDREAIAQAVAAAEAARKVAEEAAESAQTKAKAARKAADEAAESAAKDKTAAQAAAVAAELAQKAAETAEAQAQTAKDAAKAAAEAAEESNVEAAEKASAAAKAAADFAASAEAAAASATASAEAAKAAQDAQKVAEDAAAQAAADKAAAEKAKEEAEKAAAESALNLAKYIALTDLAKQTEELTADTTAEKVDELVAVSEAARKAIQTAETEEAVAEVIAAAMAEMEAIAEILCAAEGFTDVDADAWYHEAIDYVLNESMMSGNGDGTFAPETALSRAMLVQILHNIEGKPAVETTKEFSDVSTDDWYYDAVMWAAEKGIVLGNPDGTYAPNDSVTREQMVTILYRYAGSPEVEESEITFADAADVSDYAKTAVIWAVENEVVKGKGDNKFDPNGNSTRAETAQVMMNFFKK